MSPLKVSGYEGLFGVTTLGFLFLPFYFIYVGPKFGQNPRMVIEDAYDGFYQLSQNLTLCSIMIGKMVLIAFYNFACVSVTKEMSATARVIIGSARTMIIWSVSLVLGWQEFHGLQLFGFVVLCSGIFIYNDVLFGNVSVLKSNLNFFHDSFFSAPFARKILQARKKEGIVDLQ